MKARSSSSHAATATDLRAWLPSVDRERTLADLARLASMLFRLSGKETSKQIQSTARDVRTPARHFPCRSATAASHPCCRCRSLPRLTMRTSGLGPRHVSQRMGNSSSFAWIDAPPEQQQAAQETEERDVSATDKRQARASTTLPPFRCIALPSCSGCSCGGAVRCCSYRLRP